MADEKTFQAVTFEQIGINSQGVSPFDLFVFMQSSQKHLVFVAAGEAIPPEKIENLKKLSGANLWVRGDIDLNPPPVNSANFAVQITAKLDALNPASAFEGQSLGSPAGEALRDSFKAMIELGAQDPRQVTVMITDMSDSILRVVAPETGDLKHSLLKNLKNIHLMNDAAAITSLALLCALANDFRAKAVFQNLSFAALLMDAALAEIEPRDVETYYRNRKELPQHVMQKILNHTVKSHQMTANLPMATEAVGQLILTHHELHNGQGYHRGLRTGTLSPLGRVLSLAVDLYENLKGAELNGQTLSLRDAILNAQERSVEPHLRRHSAALVSNLVQFLGLQAAPKAA